MKDTTPRLSVVANFFNMTREAQNTLHSLTTGYQRGVEGSSYEVIVIDNGSTSPLSKSAVEQFGPQFRYYFRSSSSRSPVKAINAAVNMAAGNHLMIVIDGAHILSPGILQLTEKAFELFLSPFVATVPFHLGPKRQRISIQEGYSTVVEEKLLHQSGWQRDGYRLFDIAGAFSDGSMGWFGCLFESGCFAMTRSAFFECGGLDERFQSPGGGLVNLDFFQRAVSRFDLDYIVLLGEGTFHQVHGGVASNAPPGRHPWRVFEEEYIRIRGRPYQRFRRRPFYLGSFPQQAMPIAEVSATKAFPWWRENLAAD